MQDFFLVPPALLAVFWITGRAGLCRETVTLVNT